MKSLINILLLATSFTSFVAAQSPALPPGLDGINFHRLTFIGTHWDLGFQYTTIQAPCTYTTDQTLLSQYKSALADIVQQGKTTKGAQSVLQSQQASTPFQMQFTVGSNVAAQHVDFEKYFPEVASVLPGSNTGPGPLVCSDFTYQLLLRFDDGKPWTVLGNLDVKYDWSEASTADAVKPSMFLSFFLLGGQAC